MTETGGTIVNRPYACRTGTLGWPLPGTHLDIADDGEIIVSGPGVMAGYDTLSEETERSLFEQGGRTWFRTGDIGELDDDGFLRITDRKRDIFKTSNGKFFAPARIEAMFKALCPYAAQLVVDGAGRRFVSALVVLDAEAMTRWASANGMAGAPYEQVVGSPEVRDMVEKYIGDMNLGLNHWEQVKRFTILDKELTVEDGELTPA